MPHASRIPSGLLASALLLLGLGLVPATSEVTTTTPLDMLGALGDVTCADEVVHAVLNLDASETLRMVVAGNVMDCTAYSRGLLQLALEFERPKVALYLAQSYSYRSWQLYARNETNATVLLMAADLGYTDVVEELVRNKFIDPLVTEARGNTALHLAAPYSATTAILVDIARDLVPLQLAVNADGDQALHIALKSGSTASASAMIDGAILRISEGHAARVATATDAAGRQAAHLTGNRQLLRLLMRRGAFLNVRDGVGALPFHTAAAYAGAASGGALALAAAEAGGGGVDVRDSRGRTPLHYAAQGGIVENIEWLIGRGADSGLMDNNGILPLSLGLGSEHGHIVDAFSSGRSPPLTAVVSLGSLDTLEFLVLNASLPVGTSDPLTGRSAIFEAAELGRNEMVAFFLAHGANVNSIDRSGISVLAAAIAADQTLTVQLLLNHSVDIGQILQNGSTALHVAAELGAVAEADLLLLAGAAVDAADYYGQTPMHLVTSATVADRLLQYGATPRRTIDGLQPLHSAALNGRPEVMDVILRWRHGAVNEPTLSGNTPLHLAAASGSAAAVDLLLRWCADSQARNNAGRLPHQLAFDVRTASAIRDSTMHSDRCQCDCGPYDPGPRYLASDWTGGCAATLRCQLDGSQGATQQLNCQPQATQQDGSGIASVWVPAAPTLPCRVAIASARRRREVCWLWLLLATGALRSRLW